MEGESGDALERVRVVQASAADALDVTIRYGGPSVTVSQ